MTRRSIKWRHSREDDPDFKASFEKVIMEISLSSDDNCLGQSRNVEKQYFINHKESVRQNVLMIQKGLRILPKGKESAILDIGTSPMTFVYRKCFPNVRMFTIDLTSLLADRCHKNRIEHCVCDLLKDEIPFSPDQMDMVVFTEVFEHLNTGPGKVFSEIKKILRAGGILVFSLPNIAMLSKRIKAIMGKAVLDPVYRVYKEEKSASSHGDGIWVHGFGHVREYTMAETIDIVHHYGFNVLMTRSADTHISLPKGASILRHVMNPLYRVASSIVPNSGMINIVLAKKR
ncbi:MAG: class I SAM-dependent methyltransferase [Acidobacteriota bacterium]|nr:class I SAM-dependent methyltransferase [Acidobacteriota bacterium]MDD8039893.1 class I SAM-dependent methyltransferase [Acidobacteriota bacterium]